jgi:iron-sulfur cluster assembly accessory protein
MSVQQHNILEAKISLSPSAQTYVKRCLKKQNAMGAYLHVDNSGCSGMSYVFDFISEEPKNAIRLTYEDLVLFVDKPSLPFIKGTIIDCVEEGLNTKIIFQNPNARNTCGCGESFNFDGEA